MIPKIIHYCWFSQDEIPEETKCCIQSWIKWLPEFKIKKWTLKDFDVNNHQFTQEALLQKKWAFLTDYVRHYALYHYGGIYLDSDVMVYQSFDPFLNLCGFTSVEFHDYLLYAHVSNKRERLVGIEAAVLGAAKHSEWLKDVLQYYEGKHFSQKPKDIHMNLMPRVIARVLHQKYDFQYMPVYQRLSNGLEIYPAEVFSSHGAEGTPIKYSTHLGANSWKMPKGYRDLIRDFLEQIHLLNLTRKLRGIQKH